MLYNNLYVAASSQHVGKTTSTLGLVSTLLRRGLNVGYCKPVGQKFLDLQNFYVDKDTLLFADMINFEINPEFHSPVILPSEKVRELIKHPTKGEFDKKVIRAGAKLNEMHDLTIFEGTGHPGVGSVVGLSNAKVASLLNAPAILILEGGIGSTLDMMHLCSSVFHRENVPILGVIINKVKPDKMEMVREYIEIFLKRSNIPLLGVLPYDEHLAYPLMSAVTHAIKGSVEMNEEYLENRVEDMLAGSLVDLKELKSFQNLLIIASSRTINHAIKKVESFSAFRNNNECPLAGVIVTGDDKIDNATLKYIAKHKIPLVRTNFDTYGAVLKISRIEVKINRHTPWKIARAIELIQANVDLDQIIERLKI